MSVDRRCGCRNPDTGQPYGPGKCPRFAAEPRHGAWGYAFRFGTEPDPKRAGRLRSRQFRKFGLPSKRAAQSAEAKLRASLDDNKYVEPSKRTLSEYAAEVIERGRVNGLWKPTTLVGYRRYVEQDICPSRLGQMRLTEIRRAHVNAWITELTDAGRGAVTVRRALAVLRMIFSTAVRDELLSANPAFKVTLPAVPDGPSPHGSLKPSQSS
jgi:hypothetical protein